MRKFIIVRLQQEGIHRWKDCPHENVSFLREYHRHIFHCEAKIEVFDSDRELEFILVKTFLGNKLADILELPIELSCENIAEEILVYCLTGYGPNRKYEISIFEDNENGGQVIYEH